MDACVSVLAALKLIGKPATVNEIVDNQPTDEEWKRVFPTSHTNRNKKGQRYKKGTIFPAISLLLYDGRIEIVGKEGRLNKYFLK